jgi:hypothetical protein
VPIKGRKNVGRKIGRPVYGRKTWTSIDVHFSLAVRY